jgi:hypothetical protein
MAAERSAAVHSSEHPMNSLIEWAETGYWHRVQSCVLDNPECSSLDHYSSMEKQPFQICLCCTEPARTINSTNMCINNDMKTAPSVCLKNTPSRYLALEVVAAAMRREGRPVQTQMPYRN